MFPASPGKVGEMAVISRVIDKLSQISGVMAGVMICLGLALVLTEIWVRSVLDGTIYIAEEYSGYLMAMLTFLGLSYTQREKGHIRMTFLHKVLGPVGRRRLGRVCALVGVFFACVLTYFMGRFFWDSVVNRSQSMQISETYLAIPQFFLLLGAGVLALQFLADLAEPSPSGSDPRGEEGSSSRTETLGR